MKHPARIQASIDLLEAIEKAPVPMDTVCGDYFRARSFIGSKDRADIAERVYAVMRSHARLGWLLEKAGHTDTARARVLLWLAWGEKRDPESLCDGLKYSPPPLNTAERAMLRAVADIPDSKMPDSVRVECPPEHEPALRARFGDSFAEELSALIPPAPLDLRINPLLTTRERAQKLLAEDSVPTTPTPFSPWGLRCASKIFLSRTRAFVKGWVDIQDEGSQMIAHVCSARAGMQVLDFCAGAGGKTLALAGAMGEEKNGVLRPKGRIVATDIDSRRLEKGKARFRRAGVSDIIEIRPLSVEKNRKWLRRQKGTFDIVLCDAPCSGTGTWRRNPDLRWRRHAPPLAEILATQADILDRAAPAVKVGGRIVYATCSILPAENESQIEAFLQRHPDFTMSTPFLSLTPHKHGTDGFFSAVLVRTAEERESVANLQRSKLEM